MPFPFTVEQKQTAFWIAVWLAFVFLLVTLGPVLTPFLAAAIIAYALNPGVDRLAALHIGSFGRFGHAGGGLRIPRALAVLIVVMLFLLALIALTLIVVPVLRTEIPLLQAQIPQFLVKLNDLIGPKLSELGIQTRLDGAGIKALLSQQMATSGDEIWAAVLARIAGAVPRRWVGQTVAMANEVDTLLAQYLRGQLLVMLVLASYYSVALMIARFDVALPVGILTGLLVFIPYLGFSLGLTLAVIAAVLQFSDWSGLIAVAIIYGCGQLFESFFLTPRLVGERIGLNPLAVIFALLAFGQLFGFVGVLLALPASAILMVAFRHLRRHYLASSFYNA
jgi:predicted PurR-regulated permease PerM